MSLDARRPLPNYGDQKKKGQLRRPQDPSPGSSRGDGGAQALILFPHCLGLPLQHSSVGCSTGLWHHLESSLQEEGRARKGPQNWRKPPDSQNKNSWGT